MLSIGAGSLTKGMIRGTTLIPRLLSAPFASSMKLENEQKKVWIKEFGTIYSLHISCSRSFDTTLIKI